MDFVASCAFFHATEAQDRIRRTRDKCQHDSRFLAATTEDLRRCGAALRRIAEMKWKRPIGDELREAASRIGVLARCSPNELNQESERINAVATLTALMTELLREHSNGKRDHRISYRLMLHSHVEQALGPGQRADDVAAEVLLSGTDAVGRSTKGTGRITGDALRMARKRYRDEFPNVYSSLIEPKAKANLRPDNSQFMVDRGWDDPPMSRERIAGLCQTLWESFVKHELSV